MKRIILIILIASTFLHARKIVIKVATLAPEGTAWHDILIDLSQKWKKASNGEVQLRIYPGGILGDERDMVRKMRIGQIQAAALSTEGLSELAPEFSAFFLPLAYQNFEDVNNVLIEFLPSLSKSMEDQGIKLLYVSDLSWAYWFSTVPVKVPADLVDKKIFTWAGNYEYEKVYRQAGYTVVPLPGTELLSGLQTGLINTFSTVPLYALARQTFGIANHMLDMKWGVLLAGVVIDKKTWDRIPKKYHPKLIQILEEIKKKQVIVNRESEIEAIEAMKKYGLQVHSLNIKEKQEWMNEVERLGPIMRGNTLKNETFDRVMRILKITTNQ
tara:strand:+ start:198 stop:1181 length:984 start_codon:yes stop_codon:yes gene_type:complete